MWQVSDGDTTLILIGSVHQLPPDLDWQDTRVERAIMNADELLLELSPAELAKVPAQFAKVARDEPVHTPDQRISQDHKHRLLELADAAGLDEQDVDETESWALALMVSQLSTADAGLSTDNGVESVLTRRFGDADKPISGLETAVGQLSAFDALPDPVQDRMLARTIDGRGNAQANLRTTIRAWAAGDTTTIARLSAAELARTPHLAESLLFARNRTWAALLATRLRRPGTVLVAVGTGHLVGEGSLIDLLSAQGFTVSRVPE